MRRKYASGESNEELVALAQKGDKRARELVVSRNMAYVKTVAFRYIARCQHLDLDDLQIWGAMGLMTAVDKFDVSLGTKFITYATHWIHAKIRRGLSDEDRTIRVPSHVMDLVRSGKVRRQWDRFESEGLSDQEIRERIASENGWALRTIEGAEWAMRHWGPQSLDAELNRSFEDKITLHHVLADERNVSADEQLARKQEIESIRGPIEELRRRLGPRARAILDRRLLADGDGDTLGEIGETFGLTRERIRQIEAQLMAQLRHIFRTRGPKPTPDPSRLDAAVERAKLRAPPIPSEKRRWRNRTPTAEVPAAPAPESESRWVSQSARCVEIKGPGKLCGKLALKMDARGRSLCVYCHARAASETDKIMNGGG